MLEALSEALLAAAFLLSVTSEREFLLLPRPKATV